MCPGCIGTTLLLMSGTGAAGGFVAFKLRSLKLLKALRTRLAPPL
jgi:hypothetical protein